MADAFDLVVIGAGPGGYVAAIRAAQLGLKVACVDRRHTLGGTCLNVGCIPSKALLDSSELYTLARSQFARHGIRVGDLALDLPVMMARKDRVVKGLTDGVAFLFKKNKITPVHGIGRLDGAGQVRVRLDGGEERLLEAPAILLATGSEPARLPSLPCDARRVVTSTEALAFDEVPRRLVVVGGGYIGLEIGSVWARLGAKVTVLEFLPRLLPTADEEIAGLLQRELAKQGLEFHLAMNVTGAVVEQDQATVRAEGPQGARQFPADRVLVAVGRRPASDGLGLPESGVRRDERTGRIPVDENYQTNVSGVFAIGDLVAGPMLAHKAEEEGIAFAERLRGQKTHVNYGAIPSVIYTWPEVASVGLTEQQAREAGRDYRVGKFPFAANGRARCLEEAVGMVKILADAATDRILGVHIIGPRASDLIAEAVGLLEFAASAEDLARICHAHPTLSEAVREAALAVDGRAIHG